MIEIEGNKPALYQWDLNQRLVLTDINRISAGIEVHFSTTQNHEECCLSAPSYKDGKEIFADIPNVLLQTKGIISVYLYIQEENKAWTEYSAELLVVPRSRPANYVYTETEVLNYKQLENSKLDKNQGAENYGKLLFVSNDGNVSVLTLGDGLEIIDNVLRITQLNEGGSDEPAVKKLSAPVIYLSTDDKPNDRKLSTPIIHLDITEDESNIKKLSTPTIYLDVDELEPEPEIKRLGTPIIYLETFNDTANAYSRVGDAIVGSTVLGNC